MRLKLKNFKQHSDFSVEFPDRGLVLLKGETGQGKTTIFEAIFHAITGEASDILPWSGGKPVVVQFEYDTIRITRTNNPHTLKAAIEESQNNWIDYEGDKAQSKIFEYFTAHTSEFTAAYYIRQRMEGSLLSFGPSEMLRFIQKLAFGDQDPEIYKKQITERISYWNGVKTNLETELRNYTHNEMSIFAKMSEKQTKIPIKPSFPRLNQQDFAVIQGNKGVIESEIKKCKNRIESLNSLTNHSVNKLRTKYETELNIFNDYNENALKKISDLKLVGNDNAIIYDLVELENQISELSAKEQFLIWKSNLDQFTARLKDRFDDYKNQAILFLSDKKKDTDRRILDITSFIEDKTKVMMDIKRSQEIQNCPECGADLVLKNGKLKLADHTECASDTDIDKTKEEIGDLRTQLSWHNDQAKTITGFLIEAKFLKDAALKDPDPNITDKKQVEQKRNEIRALKTETEKKERSENARLEQIKTIENELLARANSVKSMKENIDKNKDIPTIEQIEPEKDELFRKIDSLQVQLSQCAEDIAEYNKYILEKKLYDTVIEQWEELQRDLNLIQNKIIDTNNKLQHAADMWAGAVRLKDISDKAALSATEGIIEAINQYTEEHINHLFPHGGTSVRIMSGTKTNKGDDRAKLALNVTHKGQPVGKSIGPLSGGEKDRVKVAFQLALADIYKASFLMLDEPFAGIDFEMTMEVCLKLLKIFSNNRLILMAQHGAPESFFDAVVEI